VINYTRVSKYGGMGRPRLVQPLCRTYAVSYLDKENLLLESETMGEWDDKNLKDAVVK
jgi:hypothetical protein